MKKDSHGDRTKAHHCELAEVELKKLQKKAGSKKSVHLFSQDFSTEHRLEGLLRPRTIEVDYSKYRFLAAFKNPNDAITKGDFIYRKIEPGIDLLIYGSNRFRFKPTEYENIWERI